MNEHQTVTVIGWIWLGLGVMAFVSGVGGFLVSTITGLPTSPLPMRSVPMDFLWQHYREGAAAQAIFAPFVVFTATMFLRRHSWARVVLQMLSALMLAWVVCFGAIWLGALASVTSGYRPQPVFMVIRIIMSFGGILVTGLFAFAFGLCIWTLSRAKILEVFRNSKPMA